MFKIFPVLFFVLLVGCANTRPSEKTPSGVSISNQNEFPYELYKPVTLSDLQSQIDAVLKDANIPSENSITVISAERYTTFVTYVGQTREISPKRKDLIFEIGRALPWIPQKQWEFFTHEMLISQNGKEYWVPIQGGILGTLLPELLQNPKFDIYFFWLGASGHDGLFLINSAKTN